MSASARHRRTKNGSHSVAQSSPPVAMECSCDHDDDAKDRHSCRHNHAHNHTHNQEHFFGPFFSMMMMTLIPRRIRRYYHYHSCSKVDVCAVGLIFIGVTLLVVQWMGLKMFLQTTFPDSAKLFQRDREFFEHDHAIPILVVGGTDGSGTRAFVHTLKRLGVLIVADDPHTFDVHAAIMFRKLGWPKLITTVLEATNGSLHYEWETLPSTTKIILEREIRKLCLSLAAKYAENKRRMRLAESVRFRSKPQGRFQPMTDTSLSLPLSQAAGGVAFAFKAPVAMLVLPLLTKFMGPIKFLHVVRDGRDIALSSNQSPVLKFYNVTYPDHYNRTLQFQGDLYPVRGIQLWNDWNVQVYEWSQKTIQKYANNNNQVTQHQQQQQSGDETAASVSSTSSVSTPPFDYLVMRSEDLIDPSTRYDCFQRLAKFVGSPLSPSNLCCLSQLQPEDFGQSTVHSESTNNFAAHPEEWEKMGNSRAALRARSKLFSLFDGNNGIGIGGGGGGGPRDIYDDPDVDEAMTVGRGERDKYQDEIESLRAELAMKDRTIRVLESKLSHLADHPAKDQQQLQQLLLQERPHRPLAASEHLNNVKDQQQEKVERQQQQKHERQGEQRRQLSETNKNVNNKDPHEHSKPKLVPTMFLKHFSSWQEHVMTRGQELPPATLQKLLEFGANLMKQYELNASALQSVVDLDEIKETCNHLKKLMQQQKRRQNPHAAHPHANGFSKKDNPEDEETMAIHERYGKWKTKLETQPVLSKWLHREGRVGLELFGYEPRQDWTYNDPVDPSNNVSTTTTTTTSAFTCDKHVTCRRPDP